MRRKKTWALVMNGVRARILRGLEDEEPPLNPPTELLNKSRLAHLHGTLSETTEFSPETRPANRRAEIDRQAKAIRRDMEEFAIYVCAFLDSHRLAGDFEQLAVFAPLPVLGYLGRAMLPPLGRTIFLQTKGNFLHLGETELRQMVRDTIRTQPENHPA